MKTQKLRKEFCEAKKMLKSHLSNNNKSLEKRTLVKNIKN